MVSIEKINELIAQGIPLSCTQPALSIPIIKRIAVKMSAGIKFADIKTDNGMICDGHHRYIASLCAGVEIGSCPGTKTVYGPVCWKSVIFDPEDWDTPAKIKMLNEQDARYNGIEFMQVAGLLE